MRHIGLVSLTRHRPNGTGLGLHHAHDHLCTAEGHGQAVVDHIPMGALLGSPDLCSRDAVKCLLGLAWPPGATAECIRRRSNWHRSDPPRHFPIL